MREMEQMAMTRQRKALRSWSVGENKKTRKRENEEERKERKERKEREKKTHIVKTYSKSKYRPKKGSDPT